MDLNNAVNALTSDFSAEQKATLLQAVEGQLLSDSQQALVLAGGGEAFKLISDGDLQAIEVSVNLLQSNSQQTVTNDSEPLQTYALTEQKKLDLNSAVNALNSDFSAEQKATLLQAVEG